MKKIYPIAITLGLAIVSGCSNYRQRSVMDNCTRTYDADSLGQFKHVIPDTEFSFSSYMDSLVSDKNKYDSKEKDNYK